MRDDLHTTRGINGRGRGGSDCRWMMAGEEGVDEGGVNVGRENCTTRLVFRRFAKI